MRFKEGATTLAGPLPLNANGQASFNPSSLTDGDDKTDLAVCRQGKTWYIVNSSTGAPATRQLP